MHSATKKDSLQSKVRKFSQEHPILFNLCMIILVGCLLMWVSLFALDIWTDHGHYQVVPSVKGLSYSQAVDRLSQHNLNAEITDSIYDTSVPPGTVTEQVPRPDSKVKSKRTVYLTISAFSPKMVSLPNLVDTSSRQARSTLEGLGFTNIRETAVASEYKDLVLGVRFNGVPVTAGTRVPVSATITLEVGQGYGEFAEEDSVAADTDVEYGVDVPEEY